MRTIFIAGIILAGMFNGHASFPQERKEILPMRAFAIQYAGSTGFLTFGYFRGTGKEKIQLGVLYGYTPKSSGGTLHSLSLKFVYNPVKINLSRQFYAEPLQSGLFLSQSFGKDVDIVWGDKYPERYYWWTPGTRFHVYLSPAISMLTSESKWLHHVSFYFEANTNDLYIASYFVRSNYKSLSFFDIIFFGTGFKFYPGRSDNSFPQLQEK